MISMCSMPRKPQRKPKPSGRSFPGCTAATESLRVSFLQRFAEILEVVGADREQTGVNLRLNQFEAGLRFKHPGSSSGSGCRRPCAVDFLDAGDDKAHFAGLKGIVWRRFRGEHTNLSSLDRTCRRHAGSCRPA